MRLNLQCEKTNALELYTKARNRSRMLYSPKVILILIILKSWSAHQNFYSSNCLFELLDILKKSFFCVGPLYC